MSRSRAGELSGRQQIKPSTQSLYVLIKTFHTGDREREEERGREIVKKRKKGGKREREEIDRESNRRKEEEITYF